MIELLNTDCLSYMRGLPDNPHVRDVFSAFHRTAIKTRYSVQGNDRGQAVTELLFSNFELPVRLRTPKVKEGK